MGAVDRGTPGRVERLRRRRRPPPAGTSTSSPRPTTSSSRGWCGWPARCATSRSTPRPPSVVEATRLADALAVVRGRPSVGLAELNDATQAVLCDGSSLPLRLITEKLIVGDGLGSVPAGDADGPPGRRPRAPATIPAPQADRRRDRRHAGPAQGAPAWPVRSSSTGCALLGIDWAVPVDAGRTTGTFKEAWRLEWRPELAVALIEASVPRDHRRRARRSSKVAADAAAATDLAAPGRAGRGVPPGRPRPRAWPTWSRLLEERTAQHHDTLALLATVEPLARTCRYGERARRRHRRRSATSSAPWSCGPPSASATACAALDDDAAAASAGGHRGRAPGRDARSTPTTLRQPWRARARRRWPTATTCTGRSSGRVNRLLLDGGLIDVDEAGRRLSRRLSVAADAGAARPTGWTGSWRARRCSCCTTRTCSAPSTRWVAGIDDDDLRGPAAPPAPHLRPLRASRTTAARRAPPPHRWSGERRRRRPEPTPTTSTSTAPAPAMATVARLLGLVPEPASGDGRADR